MLVAFVAFLLRHKKLSIKDRNLLTSVLLDSLGAVPIRDIITWNVYGQLVINNRVIDAKSAHVFQERAQALLENSVFELVMDQVAYEAITLGVHKNMSPDQGLFAKAALWHGQQLTRALLELANLERLPRE